MNVYYQSKTILTYSFVNLIRRTNFSPGPVRLHRVPFRTSSILLHRVPFSYSDKTNEFRTLLQYGHTKYSFVSEISQTNFSTGPIRLHREPFSTSPILLHRVPFTAGSGRKFPGCLCQECWWTAISDTFRPKTGAHSEFSVV